MSTTDKESSECQLVRLFRPDRILSYENNGLRVVLFGNVNSKPAILILERSPFPTCSAHVIQTLANITTIKNLGANDIYYWFVANKSFPKQLVEHHDETTNCFTDLKINLMYPCTEHQIRKYSEQVPRMVVETPEIYRDKVLPFIIRKRESGSLIWIWNIIQGKTEVNDVLYRMSSGEKRNDGFIVLPDLNWDRSTRVNLHLLGLPERKDIWSIRDLKKKHLGWLRAMREKLLEAVVKTYDWLEADQLKMYVHYQPTYYHFHIHIVHVAMEASKTLAVGKAIGLESIIESLEFMGGDEEQGIDQMTLHYAVGEATELWEEVFGPLKKEATSGKDLLLH